jgi:hypothetical protein
MGREGLEVVASLLCVVWCACALVVGGAMCVVRALALPSVSARLQCGMTWNGIGWHGVG